MIQIGDLYAKIWVEKSFHGYPLSVLKSGIQKYARRGETEEGLWCLVEMDLFSLLEQDSPELEAYLEKHRTEKKVETQRSARRIRSNMVNRLIVMMTEEINISAWWMPLTIYDLYQKWVVNRNDISSRKYLIDMYMHLTSQKMIRLVSDIKSVFLIPPDYVKPDRMNDLRKIHSHIQNDYPQIYQNQDEIGKSDWEIDLTKFPSNLATCIKGIAYNLEKGSDNVFFWIGKLFNLAKEDGVSQNKCARIVWDILFSFIDRHEDYEFVVPAIRVLDKFYSQMTHREKLIYLYHAILLLVRRGEIDWSSKPPKINTPLRKVLRRYENHLKNTRMGIDDYILDLHTRKGKRTVNSLKEFALEGAYVKNQNKKFLNQQYREIYILLKQQLDLYYSRGSKL